MTGLLEFAAREQSKYVGATTAGYRKQRGQVFTPPEIARFMAGLFSRIPRTFRLLDPGAGAGSLATAVCERIVALRSPREVVVDVFETEPVLAEILHRNLEHSRQELSRAGHRLTFTIHRDDFIAAASPYVDGQGSLFGGPAVSDNYDAVIVNPPYFKVRKDSEHAQLMQRVVHGQPNAYAFFLALAARLLKPDGELVAITPRSFCNGLYFRGFRHWFFQRMALDHVHLFESRTTFISYFDESVNGLDVGAPVKFKGVPIGEVTDVKLRQTTAGSCALSRTCRSASSRPDCESRRGRSSRFGRPI